MKSADYGSVGATDVQPPSAPPMDQQQAQQPSVPISQRETVMHVQGGDVQPQLQQQAPMQAPPPPYNEAINYPTHMPAAPPYPAYQPNTFQNVVHGPPQPNTAISGNNNNMGMPTVAYVMPTAPMPTIINSTTVVAPAARPTNSCAHCFNGTVRSEADYCCLFCLLVFSVISFPFGLVLLLFIPLAFRRRCSACRHLYT